MRHKILQTFEDHPHKILTVEIIGETTSECESILDNDEVLENYLVLRLHTIEILDATPPKFTLKVVKDKIGLG